MVIDFLMHVKPPAVGSMGNEYQCDDAAILFHLDVAANRLTVGSWQLAVLKFTHKIILQVK